MHTICFALQQHMLQVCAPINTYSLQSSIDIGYCCVLQNSLYIRCCCVLQLLHIRCEIVYIYAAAVCFYFYVLAAK
jgi:hypothetical protein